MLKIEAFVFNAFMENTYVVSDESKEAIIIDPGCYERQEEEELASYIESNELKVVKLVNTHCHIDHVFGNHFVKEKYGVSLWIHPADESTLKSVELYAPVYGFSNFAPTEADNFLNEGDILEFGNSKFDVLFVPGHAPGHIAFFNEKESVCIGGDILFNGSIGRTDLPGGNFEQLIQNIHTKMFKLPEETIVYTGHGESTTIGKEKATNPFCALAN